MTESIEVWDFWKEASAKLNIVRKAVRPYLKKIVTKLKRDSVEVKLENQTLIFSNLNDEKKGRVVSFFSSRYYRSGKLDLLKSLQELELNPEQLEMFSDDEDTK